VNSRDCWSLAMSSIVGVTSIVRNSLTCGAVNALDTIAAAVCLRTPRSRVRRTLYVVARDQAVFAGADEARQFDAEVASELAHGRSGARLRRRRLAALGRRDRCVIRECPRTSLGSRAALDGRPVADEHGFSFDGRGFAL